MGKLVNAKTEKLTPVAQDTVTEIAVILGNATRGGQISRIAVTNFIKELSRLSLSLSEAKGKYSDGSLGGTEYDRLEHAQDAVTIHEQNILIDELGCALETEGLEDGGEDDGYPTTTPLENPDATDPVGNPL